MEEIICPKCKRIQIISKNKLCNYCFYYFRKIQDLSNNKKEPFPIDYNKLEDTQIVEYLNIDKIKSSPTKTEIFFFYSLLFSISLSIFFLEKYFFPFRIENTFLTYFSIFLSIITTYYSYKFLDKKYDIELLMNSLVEEDKNIKDPSSFEKRNQLIILIFITNITFVFMNIHFINDLSSIFSPSNIYNLTVTSKNKTNLIEEEIYEVNINDWKNKSYPNIVLKVDKKVWDNIKTNTDAEIRIKRGILSYVIWSFKQE